jgi:hypothetical protein
MLLLLRENLVFGMCGALSLWSFSFIHVHVCTGEMRGHELSEHLIQEAYNVFSNPNPSKRLLNRHVIRQQHV